MATNIQTGTTSFSGATHSVTVSSYTAANAWLRFSMRVDGVDNAWDCQVVARKATSTTITFERQGNTGTVYITWWLIEDDNLSVQDIDDTGALANTTYEDHSISPVDTSRTFVDVSVCSQGNRDQNSHARARMLDTDTVRIETGAAVSTDFEYFIQVVQIAETCNPSVQEVLVSNSTGDEDISIDDVDTSKAFVVGSAYRDTSGDWPNVALHNIRLNTAGTEVELRRTDQSGDDVDAVVYVVEADCFDVQHNSCTLGTSATSNTASFTAPGNTDNAFVLCGAYYNESQVWVTSGGPDTSGHTLTPNGTYTVVTAERAVAGGTSTVEISMVEIVEVAPITFVDIDSNTAVGPSLVLDVPSGTQDGDLLIAAVIITDDVPDVSWNTVPSGWTLLVDDQATGGTPSSPPKLYVWYRIADSEPSSYTWTGSDSDCGYIGALTVYRGVSNTDPFDATRTIATGSSGNINPASITTVTPNARVVAVGFHDDDDVITAQSSGYIVRLMSVAFDPGASGNGAGLGICDANIANEGAEDPGAWTNPTEEWGAVTIALRPEAPQVDDSSQNNNTGTTVTVSHTFTAGDDKKLIVFAGGENSGSVDNDVTGVTYNGVALTKIRNDVVIQGSGTIRNNQSAWYLDDDDFPGTPGAYNVVATFQYSAADAIAHVVGLKNAEQGAPDANNASTATTSQTINTTITTSARNSLILGSNQCGDSSTFTPTSSQTELEETDVGSPYNSQVTGGKAIETAGATNMSWDAGASRNRHVQVVLAIGPVSAGQLESVAGQSDGAATVSGSLSVDVDVDGQSDGAATVSGTLGVGTDVAGQSDGAATVSGTLGVGTDVAGQSDGAATVSGTVEVATDLAGQSDGACSVTGTLNCTWQLDGQSDGVCSVTGSLEQDVPLDAQSDGVCSVTGSLGVGTEVEGQSDGVAAVSGTLGVETDLEGQSDGVAAVSGTVEVATDLTAQSDGVATVTGTINGTWRLASTVDCAATVSGSLDLDIPLETQSDGTATVSGSLDLDVPVEGQSDGVASVSGDLKAAKMLEGQSDGAATVSGTVEVQTALAAQSDGVASVSGTLNGTWSLDSTVDCTATVSGSLEQDVPIEGQSDGVALVTGSLGVLTDLTGQSDGACSVSGDLKVAKILEGQSDGVASVSGLLIETDQFTGQSDGSSTVSGSVQVATALEGASAGVSSPAGALGVLTTVAGQAAGAATVAGSLAVTTDLAGQADGAAAVAGTLVHRDLLEGQSDGAATVAGQLGVLTGLAGQSDGAATVAGTTRLTRGLAGQSDGEATVSGSIIRELGLSASSGGVATVDGFAQVLTSLSGQSDGVASVGGDFIIIIYVEGQSNGVCTVTGTIPEAIVLEGQSDGSSQVTGTLSMTRLLIQDIGGIIGQSVVTGTLEVLTRLEGQSYGSSSVVGSLPTEVKLEGQSDGAASVAGELKVNLEILPSGQSDGVASVSGAFEVKTILTAQSDGQSFVSATLAVEGLGLVGDSDGRARVSGTLVLGTIIVDTEKLEADIVTSTELLGAPRVTSSIEVLPPTGIRSRVVKE